MLTYLLRVFVSLIVGFVLGAIGMLLGAWFGGNFATEVVFNGVRGYEATGQIGFILFALIGAVTSWRVMAKREKRTKEGV
jgi:DMSO/TMAO reductase YedYZ heme-binding membrane subunit